MKSWIQPSLVMVLLAAISAAAAEFRLEDGTVLQGELVSLDDSVAVIRGGALGTLRLPRARIVEGLPESDKPAPSAPRPVARHSDPAGYALFFLPTAFTPPAGTGTFRDFELFFLNFGFSPTSSTVISAGGLFPITTDFQLLSLGFKQKLFESDGLAVAVTGNGTFPIAEDASGGIFNTNVVVSKRVASDGHDDAFGVHGVLGYWKPSDGEGAAALGAGMEFRLGPRSKFIAEYYAPLEETDAAFLNIGFRLHGDRLSADIAGFRPIDAEGAFLFFPLLVINYRF